MVDMTLIYDLKSMVKIIHFGINRFRICDFLWAVNSNFYSRTHRLTTILNTNVTERRRQTTDATL